MLSPVRLVNPIANHLGYFPTVKSGVSSFSGVNNTPRPENTVYFCGVVSGRYNSGVSQSLYCFSDGENDEVIATVYEQISKRGMVAYLQGDSHLLAKNLLEVDKFVKSFDDVKTKRFFVTLTGGATLSSNPMAQRVRLALSPLKATSIIWNTWHWLPNKWRFCCHSSYVVRLNLNTGGVKSFETPFTEVRCFIRESDFLSETVLRSKKKRLAFVDNWFIEHSQMLGSKSCVTDLFNSHQLNYAYYFFKLDPNIDAYAFLHYPLILDELDKRTIVSHAGTMGINYVILYPSSKVVLPKGPEENVTPSFTRGFEEEDVNSSTVNRRKTTRTVANVQEDKVATASRNTPVRFTVMEGDTFREQIAVLQSFRSNAFKTTLAKIQSIRQDLATGRLPDKMVGGYYVCDVTGLGGTGRGAWRLLIARKNNTLTLTCIADYHQNRFRVWS